MSLKEAGATQDVTAEIPIRALAVDVETQANRVLNLIEAAIEGGERRSEQARALKCGSATKDRLIPNDQSTKPPP